MNNGSFNFVPYILKQIVMPRLDKTGPEGKGSLTGRKMGRCTKVSDEEKLQKLGQGLGKRRHAADGEGMGRRLRSGKGL